MNDRTGDINRSELDRQLREGEFDVVPPTGLEGLTEREEALVMAGALAGLNLKPSLPPGFRIECGNCGDPVYGELTSSLDLELDCQNCHQVETISL